MSKGLPYAKRYPLGQGHNISLKTVESHRNQQSTINNQQLAINQTQYTQPAIFALEYALAQMWLSWGVKPSAVMGHSVGEYVAATIAGVFSLRRWTKINC